MTTQFDINEEVYIKAKVRKINIDTNGKISYEIYIPDTTAKLNAAEEELNKIPEEVNAWAH